LRQALAARGPLTSGEVAGFGARDLAMGRECELPARGRVAGIDASGALLVDTIDGRREFHGGSLVLANRATSSGDAP
jgi:hypothetical protein